MALLVVLFQGGLLIPTIISIYKAVILGLTKRCGTITETKHPDLAAFGLDGTDCGLWSIDMDQALQPSYLARQDQQFTGEGDRAEALANKTTNRYHGNQCIM
jgi:hypothetical protein